MHILYTQLIDCLRGEDEANCTLPTRRPSFTSINIGSSSHPTINFTKITVFQPFKPRSCPISTDFQCKSGQCISRVSSTNAYFYTKLKNAFLAEFCM